MTISLAGQLVCDSVKDAALVQAHLSEHLRLTRAEAGCLHFSVTPTPDPLVWEVREIFTNRDAFRAHQLRTARSQWGRVTVQVRRDYRILGA